MNDWNKIIESNGKYKSIIGNSPVMKEVFNTLELIEDYESPVLIEGESGTRKELLAAAVHYNSPRKDKMFVILNCSTLDDTLLSSELFGHEKGPLTDDISDKKGLLEAADGGTLFLDEIGEMDWAVQAKLTRVLEDGTFYSMGGTEQKKVDVRIVAATNKVLKKQVERGLFRKGLFYRINTVHITLPPLRKRKEDVGPLINHFLKSYAEIYNKEQKVVDCEVIKLMRAYEWPGNIRELRNVVERMIIVSGKDKTIDRNHVPVEIINASISEQAIAALKKTVKLKVTLKSIEKEIVEEKLRTLNWKKTLASRELGISRASLNNKIEEYSICSN